MELKEILDLSPLQGSLELKYEYRNDNQEKQKVLDEFVLTDDEGDIEV